MKVAVCTIISKNHLAHARVLMSAVRKSNPGLQRFVIVADVVDGYIDPGQEDFTVILSSHVPIRQNQWFHFKYNVWGIHLTQVTTTYCGWPLAAPGKACR